MTFFDYFSRMVLGPPLVRSSDANVERQCVENNTDSGNDVSYRELDHRSCEIITPALKDDVCMSSAQLKEKADTARKSLGFSTHN